MKCSGGVGGWRYLMSYPTLPSVGQDMETQPLISNKWFCSSCVWASVWSSIYFQLLQLCDQACHVSQESLSPLPCVFPEEEPRVVSSPFPPFLSLGLTYGSCFFACATHLSRLKDKLLLVFLYETVLWRRQNGYRAGKEWALPERILLSIIHYLTYRILQRCLKFWLFII